jgi:hypothetical protein
MVRIDHQPRSDEPKEAGSTADPCWVLMLSATVLAAVHAVDAMLVGLIE